MNNFFEKNIFYQSVLNLTRLILTLIIFINLYFPTCTCLNLFKVTSKNMFLNMTVLRKEGEKVE